MTRRTALSLIAAAAARAATKLPANKNVKWSASIALWNNLPTVRFTDILDIMRDTGFIGIRLKAIDQMLKTYDITASQIRAECEKRGCHVITISFNGATHDPARHKDVLASAKTAMTFLKDFDAHHLVVFPPNRTNLTEPGFKAMCDCFNQIGALANDMGFKAGLHNHMNEMVQTSDEIDRCMAMTDPKLFHFSPDIAHLYLADCDVVKTLDKHKSRLMLLDYKDAKHVTGKITDDVFDFGDGNIDFAGCHRVLKSINFKGWLCADLDVARKSPRASYEHCAQYVVEKLEPIYV